MVGCQPRSFARLTVELIWCNIPLQASRHLRFWPRWRNWYTRMLEVHVPQGVRVQLPLSAPEESPRGFSPGKTGSGGIMGYLWHWLRSFLFGGWSPVRYHPGEMKPNGLISGGPARMPWRKTEADLESDVTFGPKGVPKHG